MPKLPDTTPTRIKKINLLSEETAQGISRVLGHHVRDTRDYATFARVIREYFRANPEAEQAFVAWYTAK